MYIPNVKSDISQDYSWYCQIGYLSVIQLGKSCTRICQQEVTAQDSHLIPKLHVLQWAIWNGPLLKIDYPAMHQERCVDQLSDFCQVPLAIKQKERIYLKITAFLSPAFKRGDLTVRELFDRNAVIVFMLLKHIGMASLKTQSQHHVQVGWSQRNQSKQKMCGSHFIL